LAKNDASGLEATTSTEVTCQGEAVINNRKNKLIAAYELELKGGWSGERINPSAHQPTLN